ncbi:hypothetical protein V8F20_009036 [Naviculisporaceae sp. PSN 640]
MKPTAFLATFTSVLHGTSALSIPQSSSDDLVQRDPAPVSGNCPNGNCAPGLIAEFYTYTSTECPNENYYGHHFYYKGQDSDSCNPIVGHSFKAYIFSVKQTFGNFKCQLTVYKTSDCSDPGTAIGAPQPGATPGCYSQEYPGIAAFKVQCPRWDS